MLIHLRPATQSVSIILDPYQSLGCASFQTTHRLRPVELTLSKHSKASALHASPRGDPAFQIVSVGYMFSHLDAWNMMKLDCLWLFVDTRRASQSALPSLPLQQRGKHSLGCLAQRLTKQAKKGVEVDKHLRDKVEGERISIRQKEYIYIYMNRIISDKT